MSEMRNTLTRRHVPDVPEDVEDLMEHFNDPNWDFRPASPTLTADSYDLDVKRKNKAFSTSSRYSSSDIDTESQAESSAEKTTESKSQIWRAATDDYDADSPYPEVRAAVSNVDDPSMPVNTFRMWFLGTMFTVIVSVVNTLLGLRAATMTLTALVVQVTVLPFGKAMEYLPSTTFNTFGYRWSLNPGPFNVKEHTVITAMANLTWVTEYINVVWLVQEVHYGQRLSYKYKILLGLSSQLIGMSFAGIFHRLLIYPSSMIYPGTLVSCSLINTLHKTWGVSEKNHISRHKVLLYLTLGGAVWYFVPGFLFTGLSIFTWICWIAPTNPKVNAVFGGLSGMGLFSFSLDWSMISMVTNPLVSPWWAELNFVGSFVFFGWIIIPALYFSNVWFSQYMPIFTTTPYDNTGLPYDSSQIITDGQFDQAKYEAYSPLYLSMGNAISYGLCFAYIPASIVHVAVWYGSDLMRQWRSSIRDRRDVHARLMASYAEVPLWWYAVLFLICFAFGVIGIEIFPTGLPVWAFVIAIVITAIVTLPVGVIRAVTNQFLALSFLADLIGGYTVGGKPVAFMIMKSYFVQGGNIASSTLDNMKLGHYMKVPPRIMFFAQALALVLCTFTSQAITDWVTYNVEGACTPLATNGWTCPSTGWFTDAAIMWGAVGPQRLFSPGHLYNPVMYIMLIATLLPIPLYILARLYPYSFWRYVNIPVILVSAAYYPPSTGMSYMSYFICGVIFQWFLRRFHFRWWMRYNYIISAGLDAGLAFGVILVFLCTALPKGGLTLDWWGNNVWKNTNDAMGLGLRSVAQGEIFGLKTWS